VSEEGKIADSANLALVDDWSRDFYSQFKDWRLPNARFAWSTWEPGYLLLDVTLVRDGELSEPASVYSADEELTFATRVWHDHSPHWDFPETEASVYVKDLAHRWFGGKFKIATYYLADAWKGSLTIPEDADVQTALIEGLAWVRKNFDADRVELKGPFRSEDEVFGIAANGIGFKS